MRCPTCGARNTAAAEWCTQCYADLRDAGPRATSPDAPSRQATPAPPRSAEPPLAGPGPGPADVPGGDVPPDARARDVRTVDGEVEWRCATCDGWNALAAEHCRTCGSPRRGFGEGAPPPTLDDDARTRLLVASVLFPGLGHLLARRTGTGLARALLAAGWLVGALVIVAGAGGAGLLPAAPLVVGTAVLWLGSVRDALALVDGGPELLRPRVLSWLTGGVLTLLVVTTLVVGGRSGPVT